MSTTSLSAAGLLNFTLDAGRFKFVEILGQGSYGVVYRAVEQRSGGFFKTAKEYAVKVMNKAHPFTSEGRCQSREIVAHKIVTGHPNVLTLHDVLEDDKFIYLVLDYCPGGDMYDAIVHRHIYSQNDALVKRAFVQLIDAVQWCHDKGIFHRDLKPDNIFISNDGSKVFLGDFGLSTDVEIDDSHSTGSSFYLSPECIGEDFGFMPYSTPTSDIWSLGIILSNMIAGRNPWLRATSDDDSFHRYLSDRSFLRQILPISHTAADLMTKIFTFNPGDRISLAALRKEVLEIETFFLTEEEKAAAQGTIIDALESYPPPAEVDVAVEPEAAPAIVAPLDVVEEEKEDEEDEEDEEEGIDLATMVQDDPRDEEYDYPSPDPDAPDPNTQWNYHTPLSTSSTLYENGDSLFDIAFSKYSTPASSAAVSPADTLLDPMEAEGAKEVEDGPKGTGLVSNALAILFGRRMTISEGAQKLVVGTEASPISIIITNSATDT